MTKVLVPSRTFLRVLPWILLNSSGYGQQLADPTNGGQKGWRETQFPSWGTDAYYQELKINYKFRNQNVLSESKQIYYQTDLRIDPCRNYLRTGGQGDQCCFNTNLVGCQDYPQEVIGGSDLQVAFFQNAHLPDCAGTEFALDPNCGSTLEIHKKDDLAVVADVRLTNDLPDGYQTIYISTANLCVGMFELWMVVRTRANPFVSARKEFNVKSPSCRDPTLDDVQALLAAKEGPADGFGSGVRRLGGNFTALISNNTALLEDGDTSTKYPVESDEYDYDAEEIDSLRLSARRFMDARDSLVANTLRDPELEKLKEEINKAARLNREQGFVIGSAEYEARIRRKKKARGLPEEDDDGNDDSEL